MSIYICVSAHRDSRRLIIVSPPAALHTHLDTLGAAGILQGAKRLLEIASCRGQGGQHGRQRVASETLLQHPGQLGVPVGDEHPLLPVRDIHQGVDDVPQTEMVIQNVPGTKTCRARKRSAEEVVLVCE